MAGDLHALFGAVAENADGNAGTGEGVSVYKGLVDPKLAANRL